LGEFNRGRGRADLVHLVEQFKSKHARTTDPRGTIIPPINLPASYSLDRGFQAFDLRLAHSCIPRTLARVADRAKLSTSQSPPISAATARSHEPRIRPASSPLHSAIRLRRPACVSVGLQSQLLTEKQMTRRQFGAGVGADRSQLRTRPRRHDHRPESDPPPRQDCADSIHLEPRRASPCSRRQLRRRPST
jgi:hypothetical protein